jgi:hypothetical protein
MYELGRQLNMKFNDNTRGHRQISECHPVRTKCHTRRCLKSAVKYLAEKPAEVIIDLRPDKRQKLTVKRLRVSVERRHKAQEFILSHSENCPSKKKNWLTSPRVEFKCRVCLDCQRESEYTEFEGPMDSTQCPNVQCHQSNFRQKLRRYGGVQSRFGKLLGETKQLKQVSQYGYLSMFFKYQAEEGSSAMAYTEFCSCWPWYVHLRTSLDYCFCTLEIKGQSFLRQYQQHRRDWHSAAAL